MDDIQVDVQFAAERLAEVFISVAFSPTQVEVAMSGMDIIAEG